MTEEEGASLAVMLVGYGDDNGQNSQVIGGRQEKPSPWTGNAESTAIHRIWNGEIYSYIIGRECVDARLGLPCNFTTPHLGHTKHSKILQALQTSTTGGG